MFGDLLIFEGAFGVRVVLTCLSAYAAPLITNLIALATLLVRYPLLNVLKLFEIPTRTVRDFLFFSDIKWKFKTSFSEKINYDIFETNNIVIVYINRFNSKTICGFWYQRDFKSSRRNSSQFSNRFNEQKCKKSITYCHHHIIQYLLFYLVVQHILKCLQFFRCFTFLNGLNLDLKYKLVHFYGIF